jgi:hypothetical protein
MALMGFSLVDGHCSEGTYHQAETATYASFFIYPSLTNGLGGADEFTGSIFTLLADDGIVRSFHFPNQNSGGAINLGTGILTVQAAITEFRLDDYFFQG